MIDLEPEDIRILRALQDHGRVTNAELAETVGMSASPCWRRVRRLEAAGVIRGYSARLSRRALGLGVLAYVSVEIADHGEAVTRAFEEAIAGLDEVIACHQVTGGADYILTVVSRDLDSYADFANKRLRPIAGIKAISTSFVLKEAKAQSGLPV
ncbi:Lrp/AsnC family transcriptional regulator [Blastomonas aquatica]|uniref:AsnC family transcriptional regulator n=1 Tax=Blastomonas aquatica TaxID=1510276 RepID=A0ABQ1J7I4_9SPHN|nr:Lrp/AsnC family transcriptional regulator [Blastomonas aquatica]GGB61493.1 AsnC family transcriptional regulator [Blastomonas aquatica]